ncbi:hypothetical protein GCM10028805_37180 [Spirosoma harenae]
MSLRTFTRDQANSRAAGWSAVASGIIGILVIVCLIVYLMYRNDKLTEAIVFQRFHDGGLALQFLLMIPAAFSLHRLLQQKTSANAQWTVYLGIGALIWTAFFALLIFPKILSDGFYTVPQGLVGLWVMCVSWQLAGLVSNRLRWFGLIVGFGLILVGMFFVLYAIFVSPIHLRIPAASLDEVINVPVTSANIFLHYFIDIGSLLGVLTFPFWSILIGSHLIRKANK